MSDTSQGPGWWLASDGKWYAPELHPGSALPPPPPSSSAPPSDSQASSPAEYAPTKPVQGASPPGDPAPNHSAHPPGWWQDRQGGWHDPGSPRAVSEPPAKGEPTPTLAASAAGASVRSDQPRPNRPFYKKWWTWAIAAVVLIIVIAGIAGANNKKTPTDTVNLSSGTSVTTTTSAPAPSTTAPPTTPATAPPTTAPPTTIPPPPPPTTTTTAPPSNLASFSCSGSAPEGVDITYGSDSQNLSGASVVPWSTAIPVTAGAMYESVSAQLQGPDGDITCTVTVGGVTANAEAQGDYNIADAQVCNESDLGEGWQTCS
jgi:hypothetical protein